MGVACVTGAAGGIGRAVVARLRADGHTVLAVGRTAAGLPVAEGVVPLVADVTDPEALVHALAPWPHLDVVVANAGRCETADVLDPHGAEVWRRVLAVNLDGAFHTLRAAGPKLRAGGRALAVSSGLGLGGRAGYTAYGAAKHGVIGLVRSLALEWAPRGVTVNAVCPGWVRTAMSAGDLAHHGWTEAQAAADIPLGRFVEPEEVADLIGFLASARAGMITGQAYPISGGEVRG